MTFTGPVWDSADVTWDDPVWAWDGTANIPPAFQGEAFQADAFQAAPVITGDLVQTMPVFAQEAVGILLHPTGDISQSVPVFTQDSTGTLTVKGKIAGLRVGVFQDDAYQLDAFQSGADEPQAMPAFRQGLTGGVLAHGANFAIIHQFIPAFTQDADVALQVRGEITQTLLVFTQAATATQPPAGAIVQTMPAFTQSALGAEIVFPVGDLVQTMPSFTQRLRIQIIRWDEWSETSGDGWPVSTDDAWLVRQT